MLSVIASSRCEDSIIGRTLAERAPIDERSRTSDFVAHRYAGFSESNGRTVSVDCPVSRNANFSLGPLASFGKRLTTVVE